MTKSKKKTVKTVLFNTEEQEKIFSAAARTWSIVESDAHQIGANTVIDAIELVLDASRIVDLGKLDPILYKKILSMPVDEVDSFMKKNKASWF